MEKSVQKMSIEELLVLQKEIVALIAQKQKEKKAELKKQFQELAGEAGLTVEEILNPAKEPKKAKIKYRKDGNTWSGRGRRPAWVVEITEGGDDLEKYLVTED